MGGLPPQMTKNHRLHRRPTPSTGHGGGMCKRLLEPSTARENCKSQRTIRTLPKVVDIG